MASPPTSWKQLLCSSLATNASLPYAKYMQLATVRPDGRPANRTVVFRGFLRDTEQLTFVTDTRSQKVSQLVACPHAEVCWYFPTSREQYRLAGRVDIITAQHADEQLRQARQDAWARMSDAGRSQFMWPQPGQPRMPMDESLFLVPAPDSAGTPVDVFCLGVVTVQEADHVDLYTNQRTRFTHQPAAAAAAVTAGSRGGGTGNGSSAEQPHSWSVEQLNP